MSTHVTLTIPDDLFVRAKHLTEVRKAELSDELVDLLEQILASADIDKPQDDEVEDPEVVREMNAYLAMHPRLKRTHFGKHVAIYQGKLIDTDEDYDTLTRRIDAQYPDQFVWIATVEEEPIKTFVFRRRAWNSSGSYAVHIRI